MRPRSARSRRAALAATALFLAIGAAYAAPRRDSISRASSDTSAIREGYRLALPGYRFAFPRDHASHPEYRTEWWYYTGHLSGGGAEWGYQITFFRVAIDTAWRTSRSAWAPRELVFAHFALTDVGANRVRFDERIARPALGMAGADTSRYRTWIDDWSAGFAPDGRTHRLRAAMAPEHGGAALELELEPGKPPVLHGERGVSQKSAAHGNASHYYSLTRMPTRGRLSVSGRAVEVTGTSWMDHEFGTTQLGADQVGWDWFSIQLEDGRDLMLYRLRLAGGRTEPLSSGTLIERDGSARRLSLAEFEVEPMSVWKSPRTKGEYPARWRVRVPAAALDLVLTPRVANQELETRTTGGIAYWEGAVLVSGTAGGRSMTGRGYVEMTGYAGAPLDF